MRVEHRLEKLAADNRPLEPSVARNALLGATKGAIFAGVLLGIGVLRIPIAFLGALLGGRRFVPPTGHDLQSFAYVMAFFVGSLVLAGAGLGAATPLLRTKRGAYAGFALAGAFVGIAMMAAISQQDSRRPVSLGFVLIAGSLYGALMGCALVYGVNRRKKG